MSAVKLTIDKISRCGTIVSYPTTEIIVTGEYTADRADYVRSNRGRFNHYAASYRDGLRDEMIAAYGGKCQECEFNNPLALVLDHINDDAHIEKDQFGLNARGGHKHYARLKKECWPKDRFQLLCCNCNAIKEHTRRRDEMHANAGELVNVDRSAAQAKVGLRAHNTSGIKGVFFNSQKLRWQASILVNYKSEFLGFFDDPYDAGVAYRERAIELHGENAGVQSLVDIKIAADQLKAPQVTTVSASEVGL